MDAVSLWTKIIDKYKSQITRHVYDSFFVPVEPIAFQGNTLFILADNSPFIQEVLEQNHAANIKAILKGLGYKNAKFIVLTDREELSAYPPDQETIREKYNHSTLNQRYSFDTFVKGESNKFAHAACIAVAESPAKAYNPLFIYGGVGLGKTHLMHAIGHYIGANNQKAKILYLSSETFINELVNSIKDDNNEAFRMKYRNVDILLIDDIQFIAGKEATQEEFFHTFNTLYNANKQIVISSDRPPKEIPTLEDRLRTRFEMGLIADIQPPDFETRIAILRKKSLIENKEIPDDVIIYIAKNIKSNIRELEGALIRVIAYSDLIKKEVSYELACEALKELFSSSSENKLNASSIQEQVAKAFSVKMEDFQSKKRTRNIAYPRQIAMYLCRELTDMSLSNIGNEFGGRDHTTVIHACEKIIQDMEKDIELRQKINRIISELKN